MTGSCGNAEVAEEILPASALWPNVKKVPQFGQSAEVERNSSAITALWESDRFLVFGFLWLYGLWFWFLVFWFFGFGCWLLVVGCWFFGG